MNKSITVLTGSLLLTSLFANAEEKATPATPEKAKITAPAPKAEETVAIDGAQLGKWTMDFEAAKKLAAEKDVPIILDFSGSDWCGWCKLMEKQVFSKPAWKTYAKENLVMVLIDFPNDKSLVPEKYTKRNEALSEQYDVKGFPTFILLDSDAKTVLGRIGAGREKTPESVIAELKKLFRNRPKEVAKYLKTLPPEAQAKFKQLQDKIKKAKEGKKAAEKQILEIEKKINAFEKELLEANNALTELRISQAGPEALAAYKKLKADLDTKMDKLNAWIQTQPERNEANQKLFMSMQKEIQDLMQKIEAY